MKYATVKFDNNIKLYIFKYDESLNIKENDDVIVETEKGLQYGTVVSFITNDEFEHSNIIRKATKEDFFTNKENIQLAKECLISANDLSKELELDMKFISCSYTFDRKQLIFQFFSDNRVDFRELAKKLAYIYKTRIELRQVGVRDKAKEVSGIGMCGRKICCSSFINDLDSVSISMVKNQNLSLNPAKINGLCGRLLCCLKYEDEYYKTQRATFPTIGQTVNLANGKEAIVKEIDLLNEILIVEADKEKIKCRVSDIIDNKKVESCDKCTKCNRETHKNNSTFLSKKFKKEKDEQ